ncbi:MAG TPA: flavin reductase [Thermoplasmata archaeon]|jgi:flavin reductase (DIM6/NTAB) family NADH-FMN oxidoreductase RutF
MMASKNLRDAYRAFTTSVALITTNGPRGPNVMAAEWTSHVSYDPFLLSVHIDPANVTHDAILAAGEFGVNLAAEDQIDAMGLAGHYSKAETDKLSSELFATYPGRKVRAPMLHGSLLNAECRLVQSLRLGDHTAFIGEVLDFEVHPEMRPIVLHRGSHHLGRRIERRPRVVVTATPMEVTAGRSVSVIGEYTAPDRSHRPVTILLLDGDGTEILSASAETDEDGSYRARLRLPPGVAMGDYRLVSRIGPMEGGARVRVS